MQSLYQIPNYYLEIINHLVDTSLEVETLNKIFKKHQVKKVLDVACGVGRHAIPLAKKGFDITGIDFSPHQLSKAREEADKENVKLNFLLQDANIFCNENFFDAAICMWTTLGEEPLEYEKVIKNVYESLKEKGIFVIDNRSWMWMPKEKKETIINNIKLKDGTLLQTTINDKYTDKLRIRDVTTCIGDGIHKDLCITHLLTEKDWIKTLKKAGFKKFEVLHDYKKIKVNKPKRILIIAKK